MKTIAIVDDLWLGHHPTYIKFFAKTLLELDCKVLAFCPEPEELLKWIKDNCSEKIEHLYTFKISPPNPTQFPISRLTSTLTVLRRWQIARETIKTASEEVNLYPELVFFAWLDSYLEPIVGSTFVDFIFPYNWSGLYFQPYVRKPLKSYPLPLKFLHPVSSFKSTHCKTIAVLDEGSLEPLQKDLLDKYIIPFPDFADRVEPDLNYSLIQTIKTKAKNRKIIGLLGSLEKRKGFLSAIATAKQAREENFFFLFAGALAEETFSQSELATIEETIALNLDNCFFYGDRIPDESKFNALVASCDILFAAYENFPYSSNILTKAALFHKPVIVSRGYCMGERVEKFNLGSCVMENNVEEILSAIKTLTFSELNEYFGIKNYQNVHSLDTLKKSFENIIFK
jgi:glycosyltransferase involved in cell wall biosynthesis